MNYDLQLIKNKYVDIKNNIKKNINNEKTFNDFINNIILHSLNGNEIIFLVANEFIKTTITNNYLELIEHTINETLNSNFQCVFLTENELNFFKEDKTNNLNNNIVNFNKANTNINFLFENFVVDNFNKNAFNALRTILNNKKWNPIFINSSVGLGKTHLLNAIGNEYLKFYPTANVLYVTSDEFIREIYKALSSSDHNEIERIKDKYQMVDVLLIDDIQFFSKKDKINEIFFNIYNHNIKEGKIIILSSDKPYNQLENFEDRMKSRFAHGLNIEITKPSIEAVVKILESKIKSNGEGYIFPKDTLNYIARRNQTDIRKLEGCLNQIVFYAFNNLPPNSIITIQTVQIATEKSRQDEVNNYGYDVDPELVIEQICLAYNIDMKLVKSKSRKKNISNTRQICMYVLRKKFNMPYAQIGTYFQNRNHSTIIESVDKIEKIIKNDESLKKFIENIYKNI